MTVEAFESGARVRAYSDQRIPETKLTAFQRDVETTGRCDKRRDTLDLTLHVTAKLRS